MRDLVACSYSRLQTLMFPSEIAPDFIRQVDMSNYVAEVNINLSGKFLVAQDVL
jgi:hypothetical protein